MGSAANVIGKHLASELGMLSTRLGNLGGQAKAKAWDVVTALTKQHGYPVWVDIEDISKFSKQAKHSDQHNAMLQLPYNTAAALGVGNSWVFVNAPRIVAQRNALPRLTGVMRFLSWWQARKFVMPASTSLQGAVLQLLKEWADNELKSLSLDVFDAADKLLLTTDALGLGTRLLWLLFGIQELPPRYDAKRPLYASFGPGKKPTFRASQLVAIDEVTRRVYVNGARLKQRLRNFPTPNLDEAVRELAADADRTKFEPVADGFAIDLDYWDTEVSRWQQWHN
jgi:hypothetical protein